MVLRARWILGGAGDTDGEEEAAADEDVEDEGAGGRTDLLLPGPETLIFARPAAGLLGEEEAEVHFCPLSSTLDSSFLGCWDDNAEDIIPMESLLPPLADDMVEAALPPLN